MKEYNYKLSIVIPTWNGKEMLAQCLESLKGAPSSFHSETIVIDNGSTDGTAEMLSHQFPEAKVIRNENNLGFTKAVNAGMRVAVGEYLFVLNNDVIVLPEALNKLIKFMEENNNVGIAGCRLFYPDGGNQATCFKDRTILSAIAEAFFIDRFFKNIAELPVAEIEKRDSSEKIYPDWIMGAAMIIRRDVIEKTGGFDETSFTGDEDICFKARALGFKVGFVSDASMVHRHRQSSFPESGKLDAEWVGRMYFEFQRSGCLAFIRRNPLWKGKIFIAIKKTGTIIRLLAAILKFSLSIGDEERESARIKGHFRFLVFPFDEFRKFSDTIPSMRIILAGPALSVKGGLSRQAGFLLNSRLKGKYRLDYLETHVSGGKVSKFFKALGAFTKLKFKFMFNPPHMLLIYMSGDASFFRKSLIALIAYFFRVKTVIYCHSFDIDHFYARSNEPVKKYMSYIFKRADRVIALSDCWKQSLSYISGREDISVVPPSSPEIELFTEDGREKKYDKNDGILFMGQLEERKGIYDLLKAFAEISGEDRIDAKLILSGEDSSGNVKKFINDHNLDKKVNLTGWVDGEQKRKVLQECGIFVLPSYAEGFPLVILEAMASGLSVIASDTGSIGEIIKDGVNGYIIKPGNIELLKSILMRLLKNPEEVRKTGQAAVQTVRMSYLFSETINGIEREIEGVLVSR